MASLALRCGPQPEDARPGRRATPPPPAAPGRQLSCQATLGASGASAGVTVHFSARSLASALQLAQSAAQLGSEGVQLVGDAAKATADLAGEVLEQGVLVGVVGAAVVNTLL